MEAIILQGDSFEVGNQHGSFLKNEIQAFLKNDLARINILSNRSITAENLLAVVQPYAEIIQQQLPDLYIELEGIAQGAEISFDEVVLLQIRRELIGISRYTLTGDCSSVGIYKKEKSVLAQTIDLNGGMTDLGQIFIIRQNGLPQIIQYCFAGLLGYMGMNDAGLAVAINLVVCDGWQTGISPYLLARKFLQCESTEQCIEILKKLTIASSRSFLLMDNKRSINIEITPGGYKLIEADYLSHTNHFLHNDHRSIDTLNIFSRNSSVKRKSLLDEYLRNEQDHDAIQRAFRDHSLYPTGICAHNNGNIHQSETVAAVIMYPQQQEFWALKGKPCECNYNLFKL